MNMIVEKMSFSYENEQGTTSTVSFTYHVIVKNKKVVKVYNTAFGDWGHSVNENSEVFEHFSKIYNGK